MDLLRSDWSSSRAKVDPTGPDSAFSIERKDPGPGQHRERWSKRLYGQRGKNRVVLRSR